MDFWLDFCPFGGGFSNRPKAKPATRSRTRSPNHSTDRCAFFSRLDRVAARHLVYLSVYLLVLLFICFSQKKGFQEEEKGNESLTMPGTTRCATTTLLLFLLITCSTPVHAGRDIFNLTANFISTISNISYPYPYADTVERGHERYPDLLNGDNPGWTNPPTHAPTLSPTALPTVSPTPAPTVSPTTEPCILNEEYGAIFSGKNDDRMSDLAEIPIAVEVPFVYEVETNVYVTPEEMEQDLLPKLENAINGAMLPSLFEECVVEEVGNNISGSSGGDGSSAGDGGHGIFDGGDGTTSGTTASTNGGDGSDAGSGNGGDNTAQESSSPLDGIVGISTNPPDRVLQGVPCSNTPQEGNSCTTVEGSLTLYVTSEYENRTDEIIDATQDIIREVMESGVLNDGAVDEVVETVTYVEDGPYVDPFEVTSLNTGERGTDESGGNFPYYVAAASGAVAVGAALIIIGAKMRNRGDGEEDDDLDSNSDLDDRDFNDNPTEVAERGGMKSYDMSLLSSATAAEL